MLKVYDKNHKALCHINKYKNDIKLEEDLEGGDKTLSFSYLGRHDIQNEFYVETESDEFVVKEINRDSRNEYVSVVCALNLEGLETKSWSELNLYSQTVRQCAEYVLNGTGWTLGDCDVTKVRNIGMVEVNPLKALQNIAYAFICDVKFDSKKKIVSFYEKMGEDKGIYFMNGLNLKRLQKTSKSYDFYTRIIPIGADGLTIASVNGGLDYLENHQYSLKTKTFLWKDENYDDPSALKEDAEKKLEDLSKPELSYSADVIDLARESQKYSVMAYGLGDTVTIIDRVTMTKDVQRIKKLVRYLRDPDKNTCEISNTTLTFDEILSRLRSSEIMVNHTINPDGTIKVSDILNWEGSLYESSMYEELSGQIDDLNQKYTSIEDLIGDADIITAKDIYVEDIASTTDGITKKRVTIGSGADAVSYDYIDNGDFVLLGNAYGAGSMGGSGYFTQISTNGLLRANNAIIYGTIYATDGQFQGTVRTNDIVIKDSLKMTYGNYYNNEDVLKVSAYGENEGYFVQIKGNMIDLRPTDNYSISIDDYGTIGIYGDNIWINASSIDVNGYNLIHSGNMSYQTEYFAVGTRGSSVPNIAINALSSNSNFGLWANYPDGTGKWLIYTDKNKNVYAPGLSGSEGVGISSMSQVTSSTASSGKNTWRATLSNGKTYDFNVYNGAKGEKGDKGATGATGATGPAWSGGSVSTIDVTGKLKNSGIQSGTYSNSLCVNTGGAYAFFYKASSSLRYKDDVRELTECDVEDLFNIPVHLFKYKDGYLQKEDERYDAVMPGFYVEEIDKIIPVAVDHRADDGLPEMWSDIIMIPLMFEMIKSNHRYVKVLNELVTELRIENANLKIEIESLKAS